MTARTPSFSVARQPWVRARSAFIQICAHIFAGAITHFAALCALFLRRRCRYGKLPSIKSLRRRSPGK